MFESFPKQRTVLPPEYEAIYEQQYKSNRNGETVASSVSQQMEAWLHKKVAEDSSSHLSTLEIGAGNLNQFKFEAIGLEYDIVEPFKALYENEHKTQIRTIYNYIENVPFTNRYDRITSCATFEHIHNLPYVVAKSGLLFKRRRMLKNGCPE